MTHVALLAVVQSLSNVQIQSGNVNLVGRDLVHVHYHHYYQEKAGSPPISQKVPNLHDIQMATLGRATVSPGEWIYVWNEYCVSLAQDGRVRIIWGTREYQVHDATLNADADFIAGKGEPSLV